MGLHPDLPHRLGPRGDLPGMGPSLQSPPTPHRHQRQVTNRTPSRSQPAREEQLALGSSVLIAASLANEAGGDGSGGGCEPSAWTLGGGGPGGWSSFGGRGYVFFRSFASR